MKIRIICLILLAIGFLSFRNPVLAADPHLSLVPASGNYSQNFSAEVRVDTGDKAVGAVDVYLDFSATILKVESVTKGTALPEVSSVINNNDGKLWIIAYFPYEQLQGSFTGSEGFIAKINFSLKQSGIGEVKFVCTTGLKNESNIIEKTSNNDLIVCNSNVNGSYTASAAAGLTPTGSPTPTLTPTPTPSTPANPTVTPTSSSGAATTLTPTPTFPTTGSSWQTLGFSGLGLLLLLTGLALTF